MAEQLQQLKFHDTAQTEQCNGTLVVAVDNRKTNYGNIQTESKELKKNFKSVRINRSVFCQHGSISIK